MDAAELKLATQHLLTEFSELQDGETHAGLQAVMAERERKLRAAVAENKAHPDELKQIDYEKMMFQKQWPEQLKVCLRVKCGREWEW